jgi:hypothetical protein
MVSARPIQVKATGAGMIPESLCVANVAPQRIDASVPRNVHHFENRCSARGRGSQKSGPQAMSTHRLGVEPDAMRVAFDDVNDTLF